VVNLVIHAQFEPQHVIEVNRHHDALCEALALAERIERVHQQVEGVGECQSHDYGIGDRMQSEPDEVVVHWRAALPRLPLLQYPEQEDMRYTPGTVRQNETVCAGRSSNSDAHWARGGAQGWRHRRRGRGATRRRSMRSRRRARSQNRPRSVAPRASDQTSTRSSAVSETWASVTHAQAHHGGGGSAGPGIRGHRGAGGFPCERCSMRASQTAEAVRMPEGARRSRGGDMPQAGVLARGWLVVCVLLCRVSAQDNQRSPWNKKTDYVCLPGSENMTSTWTEVTADGGWPGRSDMGCVAFNGKIVVAGGQGGAAAKFALLNDVWTSEDAATWTAATESAEWTGRRNFAMLVHNKQLWIIGGLHRGGPNGELVPTNSIWSSSDGAKWLQVRTESAYCVGDACANAEAGLSGTAIVSSGLVAPASSDGNSAGTVGYMWAPRHSSVAFSFLGKLYVISGLQSSESVEDAATTDFRNDVWSSRDGVSWKLETAEPPWATTPTRRGRRAVQGAIHQLVMYVLAESSDYMFYYNIWGSRDGVAWTEPASACTISGQPLGAALVVGSGMVLVGTSNRIRGEDDVKLWYSTSPQMFNATFASAREPVGQGPRRGSGYVAFNGQILQVGGSCRDCAASLELDDAFADVWQSDGVASVLGFEAGVACLRPSTALSLFMAVTLAGLLS